MDSGLAQLLPKGRLCLKYEAINALKLRMDASIVGYLATDTEVA